MLSQDSTGLILVDVQGKLAQIMYEKDALFRNLKILIQGCQVLDIPIIWTEQIAENLGPTTLEIAELMPSNSPISKKSFSCCGEAVFVQALEKIARKQVLLTGIETHICVYQTAVDLLKKGHEVHVVADCVSSRTAENRQIGIEKIQACGGILTNTEMALFELMRIAEGPAFKQIIKLIK